MVTDIAFFNNMAKACVNIFGYNQAALTGCREIAGIYFIAVVLFGGDSYNNAQNLAHELQSAKERERGICYPDDIFVRKSGNTYYVTIDW
jgi:hypothetical protein